MHCQLRGKISVLHVAVFALLTFIPSSWAELPKEYHTDVEYHCQLIDPDTKYSESGASKTVFQKRECIYTFNPPTDHYEIFHYSFENLQFPEVIILPDGSNITGSDKGMSKEGCFYKDNNCPQLGCISLSEAKNEWPPKLVARTTNQELRLLNNEFTVIELDFKVGFEVCLHAKVGTYLDTWYIGFLISLEKISAGEFLVILFSVVIGILVINLIVFLLYRWRLRRSEHLMQIILKRHRMADLENETSNGRLTERLATELHNNIYRVDS